MVKTYVGEGKTGEFTVAGSAVVSGQGHLDGSRFGIVANDAAIGATGVKELVGEFDGVACLGTDVISGPGIPLYWDDGNSRLTITSATGLFLVGHSTAAKGSGPAVCGVRLDGATRLAVV